MAIQTFEDESQFNSDTGVVTNAQGVETQPITPERLQPATPFNITEVQEQPVFPVADLEVPEIELTQPEQEAQGLTEQLQELTSGLVVSQLLEQSKKKRLDYLRYKLCRLI